VPPIKGGIRIPHALCHKNNVAKALRRYSRVKGKVELHLQPLPPSLIAFEHPMLCFHRFATRPPRSQAAENVCFIAMCVDDIDRSIAKQAGQSLDKEEIVFEARFHQIRLNTLICQTVKKIAGAKEHYHHADTGRFRQVLRVRVHELFDAAKELARRA
jgi:hypothetical protein